MATELNIVDCSESAWESWIQSVDTATLFSQSSFLNCSGRKIRYLLCHADREVLAGVALPLDENGVVEVIYGGIVYANMSGFKEYKRIEKRFAASEKIAAFLFDSYPEVHLSNYCDVTDMRAFQWHNYHDRPKGFYQVEVRYTSLLDIHPDRLLKNCKEVRLNSLKTAAKAELQSEISTDIAKLDRLHELTFQRQGLVRREDEGVFVRNVAERLIQEGCGRLFITSKQGVPASAAFFGFDQKRAYYIFGASDPEFRKTESGTENLFFSFKNMYADLGLTEVDLLGVNSPQRGGFKLTLGGRVIPYFQVRKIPGGA